MVVNVDDDQVSQSQSSEDDVRPIQRVVFVDFRHRDIDERFLFTEWPNIQLQQKQILQYRDFAFSHFNKKKYIEIQLKCQSPQVDCLLIKYFLSYSLGHLQFAHRSM